MIDYDNEQSTLKNIWIIYNNFLQDKIHDINYGFNKVYVLVHGQENPENYLCIWEY